MMRVFCTSHSTLTEGSTLASSSIATMEEKKVEPAPPYLGSISIPISCGVGGGREGGREGGGREGKEGGREGKEGGRGRGGVEGGREGEEEVREDNEEWIKTFRFAISIFYSPHSQTVRQ